MNFYYTSFPLLLIVRSPRFYLHNYILHRSFVSICSKLSIRRLCHFPFPDDKKKKILDCTVGLVRFNLRV